MGLNQSSSCYCPHIKQKPLYQSAVIQLSQTNNRFIIKGTSILKQIKVNQTLTNNQHSKNYKSQQINTVQVIFSLYHKQIDMRISLQYIPIVMRLLAYNQQTIFNAMSTLNIDNSRIQFINKICQIDLDMMDSLYQNLVLRYQSNNKNHNLLKSSQIGVIGRNKKINYNYYNIINKNKLKPLSISQLSIEDKIDLTNKGHTLLNQGKIAIVFMCSGPSARFYFQDKFLHTLEIQNQDTTILKVMFQKLRSNVLKGKLKLIQNQIIDLPIVLIGNETNTQSIQQYLRQNNFFNFNKHSIYFSTIPSLPILNKQGKLCMNFEYNYLRRPKGSACCLQQIINPQAMQILKQRGIQYVHIIGTQNLGQNPGDPIFIGLTKMLKRNIAIKCTKSNDEIQSMKFDQIILNDNNKLKIISKFQLSQQLQNNQSYQSNNLKQQQLNRNNYQPQQQESYIAMNSMIFQLNSLPQIIQKFNYNPQQNHTRPSYRCYQIKQNIYDFKIKKPLINQQCYTFQKDIKDTIIVSDRPLVVQVNRCQFIPIISHKNQYSVDQAIDKYLSIKYKNKLIENNQKINNNQLKSNQSFSSSTKSLQQQLNHNNYNKTNQKSNKNQYFLTQ